MHGGDKRVGITINWLIRNFDANLIDGIALAPISRTEETSRGGNKLIFHRKCVRPRNELDLLIYAVITLYHFGISCLTRRMATFPIRGG